MLQRHLFILLFTVLTSSWCFAQTLFSPDGKIKVLLSGEITDKGKAFVQPHYSVYYKLDTTFIEVVKKSPLGIHRSDNEFTDNILYNGHSEPVLIEENYEMVCGKRRMINANGNEITYSFITNHQEPLNIVFRAYNDGIVFRYNFPRASDTLVNI